MIGFRFINRQDLYQKYVKRKNSSNKNTDFKTTIYSKMICRVLQLASKDRENILFYPISTIEFYILSN